MDIKDALTPQFRGWWIPADVVSLFQEKKIKAIELILLASIDGLVRSKGAGCYATNNQLGSMVGVSGRRIEAIIKKLRRLKLLRTVRFDGRRRTIETRWSRVLENADSDPSETRTPPYTTYRVSKQTNSARNSSRDKNMALIEGWDKKEKRTIPQKCDFARADLLHKAVVEKAKVCRRYGKNNWANHFRRLRELDNIKESRIDSILKWYCSNLRKEYVPRAYDAATFRAKFLAIEDAKKRAGLGSADVEITSEIKPILDKLSMLKWPKGSKELLPPAIQLSINQYTWFRQQLINLRGSTSNQLVGKMCTVLLQRLGSNYTLIVNWFTDQQKRIINWDAWSGNLRTLHFVDTQFQKQCQTIARDYAGDAGIQSWKRIVEEFEEIQE